MHISDEFAKIQSKIMSNTVDDPRLARLTESIQSSQSFLDGNFLVENRKLKELLNEAKGIIYNLRYKTKSSEELCNDADRFLFPDESNLSKD
jgi:hypothetical protein